MKRLLIIILFLFLLCSCSKKEDVLIGVSRINESVICDEYCTLDLKIISNTSLDDIKLDKFNIDANYDYIVEKSKKEVKISEDIEKKIYSYDLSVKLYEAVNITSVDLIIDQENYTFNIGSFKCLDSDASVLNHIDCFVSTTNNLSSGIVNHKIEIVNKMKNNVLLTGVSLLDKDEDILVCKSLDTKIVKNNEKKEAANSFISIDEDLYRLNYILKIGYIYEGAFYETSFVVQDSSIVESVSTEGNCIVINKSCFVLNE